MVKNKTSIVCDDCGKQSEEYNNSGTNIRRLLVDEHGWGTANSVDRCPKCFVKHKAAMLEKRFKCTTK